MIQLRVTLAAALTLGSLAISAPAAAQCSIPHVLTNGQVADASEVMDNFNAVADCADDAVTPDGSPQSGEIAVFSGAQTVTGGDLSGDVSTSGSTVTSLAATGVAPGSYSSANIVVDAKGRITSASDGAGATANRFAQIRLLSTASSATVNVNSMSFVRIVPLSFATDLTYFPWTSYEIAISGLSSQTGHTLTIELRSVGGGDPVAGSGNDLVVNAAGSLYRSGWIARTDGRTGPQEYTLYIKGTNTTVDLSSGFIDILLKI